MPKLHSSDATAWASISTPTIDRSGGVCAVCPLHGADHKADAQSTAARLGREGGLLEIADRLIELNEFRRRVLNLGFRSLPEICQTAGLGRQVTFSQLVS